MALLDIRDRLGRMGKTMAKVGLMEPIEDVRQGLSKELQEELDYDREMLQNAWKESEALMNADQINAFQEIVASLEKKDGKCFFIDAPGGSFFCLCLPQHTHTHFPTLLRSLL